MSKKGTTQNIERPQSSQELALLETQNAMQQQAIDVAKQQEDRSNEQHDLWKQHYLPMEVAMNGDAGGTAQNRAMLDNQMPRYAEDTSGVMNQPQGSGSKGGQRPSGRPSSGKGA